MPGERAYKGLQLGREPRLGMRAQVGNATREQVEAREAELEALGADPDIYAKLVASLAPSIWQMEDVKRGILCQLFGGTSKVRPPQRAFRWKLSVDEQLRPGC